MYGSSAAHVPGRCWCGNDDDGDGGDDGDDGDQDVKTALTIRPNNVIHRCCDPSESGSLASAVFCPACRFC